MLSLSLSSHTAKSPIFPSRPKWTHMNTLAMCQPASKANSKNEDYPESLASHLSSLGVDLPEPKLVGLLPHPAGHACELGKGPGIRLTTRLPGNPLTVPRLPTAPSPCTQPTFSRTCALLEAVSHWTEKSQWLASGLNSHMNAGFGKVTATSLSSTMIEADELRERKDCALGYLVKAYQSADS